MKRSGLLTKRHHPSTHTHTHTRALTEPRHTHKQDKYVQGNKRHASDRDNARPENNREHTDLFCFRLDALEKKWMDDAEELLLQVAGKYLTATNDVWAGGTAGDSRCSTFMFSGFVTCLEISASSFIVYFIIGILSPSGLLYFVWKV